MIKAVLFDYGGVLAKGGGAGSVRSMLAASLGIDESAIPVIGDIYYKIMLGTITTEAFIDALMAEHPDAPTRPTIETLLSHANIFDAVPEVYALAERLRSHGIATGVLSNILAFAADEVKRRGLFDGFSPVVLSCDVHMLKPEQGFYQAAIQQLGVAPAEIVFIDDRPELVDAAKQAGMQGLVAHDPAQIVADITQLVQEQNNLTL